MRVATVFLFIFLAHYSTAQSFYLNSPENIAELSVMDDSISLSGYATKPNASPVAEGLAAVADSAGNLLFVVDGSGLYNSTGELVPRSDDMLTHHSSSEIAVCPVVDRPDEYYIFYNTEQCSELYYSTVRVNEQKSVTVLDLNVPLDPGQAYAEGLEIVKSPCKNLYFLVGFACDEGFRTFSIDSGGISLTSRTKHDVPDFSGRGVITYQNGKLGYSLAFQNKILLADFDSSDGIVSAIKEIAFPATNGMYGLAFTREAEKVFVTDWNNRDIFGQPVSPNLFAYNLVRRQTDSWTIDVPDVSDEQVGLSQIVLSSTGQLLIPVAGSHDVILINHPEREALSINKVNVGAPLSYGITQVSHFPKSSTTKIVLDGHTTLCDGEAVLLHVEESLYEEYQWFRNQQPIFGAIDPSLTVREAGIYSLIAKTRSGCLDTLDPITVAQTAFPAIDLGDTIRRCPSEPVILHYPNTTTHQIRWSTGDTTANISIYHDGVYWLEVSNEGCSITDTVVVSSATHSTSAIPNVFTPNGDAYNQYFTIPDLYRQSIALAVYNRWGVLVYYSTDYQNDWDGSDLASGVYYYIVSDNSECSDDRQGWVTIIR